MMFLAGLVLFVGGGWVTCQSTSSRFSAPVAFAGMVLMVVGSR